MLLVALIALPALLILGPFVAWSCARDSRKRRAFVEQSKAAHAQMIAKTLQDDKDRRAEEAEASRKQKEHFVKYGTYHDRYLTPF